MMMIGIIGAMDIEVNGIIEKMTNKTVKTISGTVFTSGKIHDRECVVAKCGIGKVNAAVAAQTMILTYRPDCIINTGIGGSTSRETHVGHVVIAKNVVQHDMDTTAIGDEPAMLFLPNESLVYIPCDEKLIIALENACESIGEKNYAVGTVATGDKFISGNENRVALHSSFHALACEMEGGSIGQVCYINNVPFAILRSISDSMSEQDDAVEYAVFSKIAAEKSIQIISAFITNL